MSSGTGPTTTGETSRRTPESDVVRPAVGRSEPFVKGHGTGNDFVLLPDADDRIVLTEALARALCDRRCGIGADGVIRVARSAPWARQGGMDPAAPDGHGGGLWCMDHRNADGSPAEMCGNGARVFGRYLVGAGLAPAGRFQIGTHAGPRTVDVPEAGDVTVDLGPATVLSGSHRVRTVPGVNRPNQGSGGPHARGTHGIGVSMGNPHVVVEVVDTETLAALNLSRAPDVTPGLPNGENVEFVVRTGARSIQLRVHERGVGETASCGTGICAAVAAMAGAGGVAPTRPWEVSVPGGRLTVAADRNGALLLTGPAVLVAQGRVDLCSLGSGEARQDTRGSGRSNAGSE